MIRLHSIFVRYDKDQDNAVHKEIKRRLGNHMADVEGYTVCRRSIDARHRPVRFVYSVDIQLKPGTKLSIDNATPAPETVAMRVTPGTAPLADPPVVIGGGPAGLFAALLLADHGYRPKLFDRGGNIVERAAALHAFAENRRPDPENNALFGLGGAGTFSDGKLRTGVNHPWLPEMMRILAECGAPEAIRIDAKPHIGTDILLTVVENLVKRIEAGGGEVSTGVRMERIRSEGGVLNEIETTAGVIPCRTAVLAIGHSARDTWQSLAAEGVRLEPKPFQLGIRVEHPQAWIDAQRYGRAAGDPRLGAADYKLAAKVNGTPVFTFCMCPGGETIPTVNEPERLAINGMSLSRRASAYASSGVVVTLPPEIYGGADLASALAFQRRIEAACFEAGGRDYTAPAQRLTDFVSEKASTTLPQSSYGLGVTPVRLDTLLPPFVSGPLRAALPIFDVKLRGYLSPDALALAPESRASSPIRVFRDRVTLESSIEGLYPAGEGAGYAGGITSAALDGLNAATRVIEKFAPPT